MYQSHTYHISCSLVLRPPTRGVGMRLCVLNLLLSCLWVCFIVAVVLFLNTSCEIMWQWHHGNLWQLRLVVSTHWVFQQVADEEGEGGVPWLLLDWQSQLMLLYTQTNSAPTSRVVCEWRREGRERGRRKEVKYFTIYSWYSSSHWYAHTPSHPHPPTTHPHIHPLTMVLWLGLRGVPSYRHRHHSPGSSGHLRRTVRGVAGLEVQRDLPWVNQH